MAFATSSVGYGIQISSARALSEHGTVRPSSSPLPIFQTRKLKAHHTPVLLWPVLFGGQCYYFCIALSVIDHSTLLADFDLP